MAIGSFTERLGFPDVGQAKGDCSARFRRAALFKVEDLMIKVAHTSPGMAAWLLGRRYSALAGFSMSEAEFTSDREYDD